ncbi:hypothetical protein TNCV_914611 [Trichonephila clavipes]|uniref:Uncharacterized protein n=1 Tax=Trichonephila clavipes TaxID=2585209 RepID=A0A8X6UUB4_TRICX|nr:hypothetical protein TNCV_914611 [Trichonephila clavipes]
MTHRAEELMYVKSVEAQDSHGGEKMDVLTQWSSSSLDLGSKILSADFSGVQEYNFNVKRYDESDKLKYQLRCHPHPN